MADPAEPGVIRAAGAVVWRRGAAGTDIVLVHRPRYDDWSIPKGKTMPGEHVLLTAVREVAEEAGVRVALGRRLPTTHYVTEGRPKRVDYWAARPVSPDAFTPNEEVDSLAWLPVADAALAELRPRPHGARRVSRRAGRHHPGDPAQARRRDQQEGLAPGRS